MYSNIYEAIYLKVCIMINTSGCYSFELVYLILTLIQGHRNARKGKLVCQLFHNFLWIWMEFCVLLRLVHRVHLIPILPCPSNIEGRYPTWVIPLKIFNACLHFNIYQLTSWFAAAICWSIEVHAFFFFCSFFFLRWKGGGGGGGGGGGSRDAWLVFMWENCTWVIL